MLIFKRLHRICLEVITGRINWNFLLLLLLNAFIQGPYRLFVFIALLAHPADDGCVCSQLSFALTPMGCCERVRPIPAKAVGNRSWLLLAFQTCGSPSLKSKILIIVIIIIIIIIIVPPTFQKVLMEHIVCFKCVRCSEAELKLDLEML